MSEKLTMWVAWHLPRRLAYWCAIRVMAWATMEHPDKAPDEISTWDILKAWPR